MFKLEVIQAPDSEASADEFNFVVDDLILSMADRLGIEKDMISKDGNAIKFESNLTEKEIKEKLKNVFSHHFDILRFSSLNVAKKALC